MWCCMKWYYVILWWWWCNALIILYEVYEILSHNKWYDAVWNDMIYEMMWYDMTWDRIRYWIQEEGAAKDKRTWNDDDMILMWCDVIFMMWCCMIWYDTMLCGMVTMLWWWMMHMNDEYHIAW